MEGQEKEDNECWNTRGTDGKGGRITCVGQMPFPYICNKNREHEKNEKIRR